MEHVLQIIYFDSVLIINDVVCMCKLPNTDVYGLLTDVLKHSLLEILGNALVNVYDV